MKQISGQLIFVLLLYFSSTYFTSIAFAKNETKNSIDRPKIGLVLSGGGARGFAHIGVLKALEELNIPVDIITGTSMGSIVGGMYAMGMSPDEIETTLSDIDWFSVFNDYSSRNDEPYHLKNDDLHSPIKHRIGLKNGSLTLPPGLVEGQVINLALLRITRSVAHINNFDHLSIPFRAIGTDIETGEAVIIKSGSLAEAMRASLSIPGVLSPVKHKNHLLVDGGMSNNLPINIAKQMGADIIIAIDISTQKMKLHEIESTLDITGQLTNFITRKNVEEQIATLTTRDVLLVPDLQKYGSSDFTDLHAIAKIGYVSAKNKFSDIDFISLPEDTYYKFKNNTNTVTKEPPVIEFIELDNLSRLKDEIILGFINQKIGERLDLDQLENDIAQIYGLDIFDLVTYALPTRENKTGLLIRTQNRAWAPSYFQFNISSRADGNGNGATNLGISLTTPELNSLGGEWRTRAQVGAEPGFSIEIYQPLDTGLRYFVSSSVKLESQQIFEVNNGTKISRFTLRRNSLNIATGRNLGSWGEARLGVRRTVGETRVEIGAPLTSSEDFDEGSYYFQFAVDTLDNIDFPTEGFKLKTGWEQNLVDLESDTDYEQFLFTSAGTGTWGRYTVIGRVEYGTTIDSNAPFNALFRPGGFLRLSGLTNNELEGQHYGIVEAIFYRRLGDIGILPTYAGFSVEEGNAWDNRSDISLGNALTAGSIFIGVDTVLGPVYLAYGHTSSNEDSIYLYLGHQFF